MENKTLVFAGGCFWGVQAFARRLPSVSATTCGYANGTVENPTYEQVCTGTTGHAETVRIKYDPAVIPLAQLARELFTIIDPAYRHPSQYRTGFYYGTQEDRIVLAGIFNEQAQRLEAPVVTELLPLSCFYPAEDYHQDYLEIHPDAFCHVDLSRFGIHRGHH